MSRGFSRLIHVAAAAAFVFGSALTALPQEKTGSATSVGASSQPDAIAGAKKDFESIKSSREAALQPQGEVPRVTMPEWQGVSPLSPGSGAQPRIPLRETKSASWLVDAMAQQSGSRTARDQSERNPARDRDTEAMISRDRAREDKDAPDERRSPGSRGEKDQRNTVGAVNPLARYLGDWMTPQDYALLKPGLANSLGSGAADEGAAALGGMGSAGTLALLPGGDRASGSLGPVKPAFARPVPRENPFLQSIGRPESAAQVFASQPKLTAAAPAPASSPASLVPPPLTAPQSKIPEFAKPATDEKYFKPLKRF